MAGTTPTSVAVRLGVEGDAEVKTKHDEVGKSGQAAFEGIATSADQASAATDRASAAVDRQAAKYARMADAARAAASAQASQRDFNVILGVGGPGKTAADSASVFEAAARAEEDLARRTAALRAEIDPLYAAQVRLNGAIENADRLHAAGSISAAEHAAALKLAQTAYADAEKSARALGGGISFSQMQMQEFGAVAHRSFDAIAAGMPIQRVATMEGARLTAALGSGQGGLAGVLRFLVSPLGLAIEGFGAFAAVMIALGIAEEGYQARERETARLLQGSGATAGLTVAQFDRLTEAVGRAADVSTSEARKIETALLETGRIGADALKPAVEAVKGYAELTGQGLDKASQKLAPLFADPAKGAKDLNDQLHFLTAAELQHIKSLEEQGDRAGALDVLLKRLNATAVDSAPHLTGLAKLGHDVGRGFGDAADKVGEFVAKMLGLGPAQERLAALIQQRAGMLPGAVRDNVDRDIAQLRDQVANDNAREAARTRQAQQSQQSADLKAAADALNPTLARIAEIQGRQAQLRAALNSPSLLSAAGLSKAQADAAIVQGDKEIKQLQDRAAMRDKHAESLARDAEAMVVDTRQNLILADAYLQGGAAAFQAEARRKALTDATKKGIDGEEQYRRQLALNASEVESSSAKAVRQLLDESGSRKTLNDLIEAGVLGVDDLTRGMQDEAALRPLLILQTMLHGAELAKLIEKINAYRAALAGAHAEEARSAADAANDRATTAAQRSRLEASFAGDTSGARERALAAFDVEQEASRGHYTPEEAASRQSSAADQVNAELAKKRADYVASTLQGLRDSNAQSVLEASLVGKSNDERDRAMAILQATQGLKAEGVALDSDEARAVLAQVAATEDARESALHLADAWAEVRGFGEQFVDDVLSPQNWSSWGDAARRVLTDIVAEFEKLAVINPLKNALFGDNLPTSSAVASLFKLIGHNAGGTSDWGGGLTWVAENGPELINLPAGSSVTPAGQTRAMMGGGGAVTASVTVNVDATGADPEGLARVQVELARLRQQLPTLIVTTVSQAQESRLLRRG